MRLRLTAALLAFTSIAHLVNAGPTIASLAPRHAFAIISCDNAAETIGALKRSSLTDLWNDKQIRAYLRSLAGDSVAELLEPWEDIGVSPDDLQPPSAAFGAALFLSPEDALPAGAEHADEGDQPQALLFADYSGAPDGAAATIDDAIERLVKKAVSDETAAADLLEYDGHEITRLTFKRDAPKEPEPFPGEEGDDQDVFPTKRDADGPSVPSVLLITRVGDVFFASSHLDTLHDAIDRLAGKDLGEAADDHPEFLAALDMLGNRADQHAYAVFHVAPLFDMLRDAITGDPYSPLASLELPLALSGIDKVKSVAGAVRFDSPDAAAQYTAVVRAPEKSGLIALLNAAPAPFSPPSFVSPDAANVYSIRLDFANLVPTLRTAFSNLPDDMREEAAPFLEEMLNTVGAVTGSLASEAHIITRIAQPYSATSRSMLFAVAVKDPQPIIQTLSALAQGFLGFTPRDYLGHQLWESEMPIGGGMAFSVGAGWLFSGTTAAVEDALREASNPDRPKLADDEAFRASTRAISGPAVMHSWSRLRPTLQYSAWSAENFDKILEEQVRAFGLDPDQEREYLEMMRESAPPSARVPVPAEAILRHMGDIVGDLRATPEGFVSRGLFLRSPR